MNLFGLAWDKKKGGGVPGRPRHVRSKLPLLHSCPGGVRKSTIHGP